MAVRSAGRKLSFGILTSAYAETDDASLPHSVSDPSASGAAALDGRNATKKRKKRKAKKSSVENFFSDTIFEGGAVADHDGEVIDQSSFTDGFSTQNHGYSVVETCRETAVVMEVPEGRGSDCRVCTSIPTPELTQVNVNFVMNRRIEAEAPTSSVTSLESEESRDAASNENKSKSLKGGSERVNEAESQMQQRRRQRSAEMNGGMLETEMSLDWKKLIAEDPNHFRCCGSRLGISEVSGS